LLQEVFARFYLLVKIAAAKISIDCTGDKGFHICSILVLWSDHMLLISEKNMSPGADMACVGLSW